MLTGVELQALAALPLDGLLLAGAVALALLFLAAWWRGGRVRRRLRAQWVRAGRGEDRAETLLARAGFRLEGRQVSRRYALAVDDATVSVLVRADFLVRRGGRRYVAEVKTGKLAPRIETPSTRRQLLEYRVVFGVDGVLLVDAESDRISSVEFPQLPRLRRAWGFGAWAFVTGALVAVAVAAREW